jgi:hypothetical protein
MHDQSTFLTLTYSPEHLPNNGTLVTEDMQKFFKRLRDHLNYRGIKSKIRYMYCGEYGEETHRPHYHILLYGYEFKDPKLYNLRNGIPNYTSKTLDKIWGKGNCMIGNITVQSAQYVARYIMKKVNGPQAKEHYSIKDENNQPLVDTNGEIMTRKREYIASSTGKPNKASLGGGIGASWFEKYHSDVYPRDEIILNGRKRKVPTYYDKLLERLNPDLYETIKKKRLTALQEHKDSPETSFNRLMAKHTVLKKATSQLIRPL